MAALFEEYQNGKEPRDGMAHIKLFCGTITPADGMPVNKDILEIPSDTNTSHFLIKLLDAKEDTFLNSHDAIWIVNSNDGVLGYIAVDSEKNMGTEIARGDGGLRTVAERKITAVVYSKAENAENFKLDTPEYKEILERVKDEAAKMPSVAMPASEEAPVSTTDEQAEIPKVCKVLSKEESEEAGKRLMLLSYLICGGDEEVMRWTKLLVSDRDSLDAQWKEKFGEDTSIPDENMLSALFRIVLAHYDYAAFCDGDWILEDFMEQTQKLLDKKGVPLSIKEHEKAIKESKCDPWSWAEALNNELKKLKSDCPYDFIICRHILFLSQYVVTVDKIGGLVIDLIGGLSDMICGDGGIDITSPNYHRLKEMILRAADLICGSDLEVMKWVWLLMVYKDGFVDQWEEQFNENISAYEGCQHEILVNFVLAKYGHAVSFNDSEGPDEFIKKTQKLLDAHGVEFRVETIRDELAEENFPGCGISWIEATDNHLLGTEEGLASYGSASGRVSVIFVESGDVAGVEDLFQKIDRLTSGDDSTEEYPELSDEEQERRLDKFISSCGEDALCALSGYTNVLLNRISNVDDILTVQAKSTRPDGVAVYHHFFYDFSDECVDECECHRLGQVTNVLCEFVLGESFCKKGDTYYFILYEDTRPSLPQGQNKYFFLRFGEGAEGFARRRSIRLRGDITPDMTPESMELEDSHIILVGHRETGEPVRLRYSENGRTELLLEEEPTTDAAPDTSEPKPEPESTTETETDTK